MDRKEYHAAWYLQHREEIRLKNRKKNPKQINLYSYTITAPNGMQKVFRTAEEVARYMGYNSSYMQKLLRGPEPHIILGYVITKKRRFSHDISNS